MLILAVGAVVAVVEYAPRWFTRGRSWVTSKIAEEQAISAMVAAWMPPSEAPDASWFPNSVGDWQLEKRASVISVALLDLDRAAEQAVYRWSGETVSVHVISATESEKDALFARAKDRFAAASGTKVTTGATNRLYLRLRGTEHTRLWWLKGWLFVFESRGAEDPWAFAQALIRSIDRKAPTNLER